MIYLYALFIFVLRCHASSTDIWKGHSDFTAQCKVPTTIQNGDIGNCQNAPALTPMTTFLTTPSSYRVEFGCTARCNPGYGPYGLNTTADIYCVQARSLVERLGEEGILSTRETVDPNCQPLIPVPQTKPDASCASLKTTYKENKCCQKAQLPGWTNWSACSASCNGGIQVRFCHNPNSVTNLCNGPAQRECNTYVSCPWIKTCEDCRKHCSSKLGRNVSMYELQSPKTTHCGICPRLLCSGIMPVMHDIHLFNISMGCLLKARYPNGGAPQSALNEMNYQVRQNLYNQVLKIPDNFRLLMAYVVTVNNRTMIHAPYQLPQMPSATTDKVESIVTFLNALRSTASYPLIRSLFETTSFKLPATFSNIEHGTALRYVETFNRAMDVHTQFSKEEANRLFLCGMWNNGFIFVYDKDENGAQYVSLNPGVLQLTEDEFNLLNSIYPRVLKHELDASLQVLTSQMM